MRETPKAKQAWNDYLAMGPGRSLEKLAIMYQTYTGKAPTVHLRTLKAWSVAHCWQRRLEEIAEAERQAIVARGIAEKQNRVDALGERWQLMRQVVQARAKEMASEVAGGTTGLLVRQAKLVKVYGTLSEPATDSQEELVSIRREVLVYDYAVDTGLLKELREHEKQAAIELGQWTEKREDKLDGSEDFLRALREFGRGGDDNT